MWRWDQGRMAYFQYDVLRAMSEFALTHDVRNTPADIIRDLTGLEFLPVHYHPWRNYARVLKLCLIACELEDKAVATDIATILAQPGAVTCDEYIHFLAEATTDPSPGLNNWNNQALIRYPLAFTLKYILAKTAVLDNRETSINEIIGAYIESGFSGDEDETDFVNTILHNDNYADAARNLTADQLRQSRESVKFLCQISYLHSTGNQVIAALSREDAAEIFRDITPIGGPHNADGTEEILRVASLFRGGSIHDFFDYQTTTISNELDSGFVEGSKVKKSHIVIERNSQLRNRYFQANPTAVCDACALDTHRMYPWTDKVLDVHHILPLSSGTRVDSRAGTLLADLIAVCPNCHRAIHRYYDNYLKNSQQNDFSDRAEAVRVYWNAKSDIANEHNHAP